MKRLGIALGLSLLLLALLPGCHGQEGDDTECDFVVLNDSHTDLKVLVDGWDAGTVREDGVRTVDDVGAGRHVLEAVDPAGHVVERRYVDLARGEDFTWRLESH
jgi:hypothetical protein